MTDGDRDASDDRATAKREPPRSRLRQLLDEHPEIRSRLGRAVAALLGTGLVAFAAFGAFLIWHIVRRGRLIRERLNPPRIVRLPEFPAQGNRSSIMKVKASFRPHERLKDPKDFRRAFDRRRSESDSVLVIYGVENSLAHSRLGISVARKKVRAASSRNRLKRLVREAFRLSKAELPFGIDLVVIPRTQNSSALSIRNSLVES